MTVIERERTQWGFEEGEEILPGRHALSLLGGGRRYEVYLAWDERLHSVVAVKLLRPDRIDNPSDLGILREEVAALRTLHHPVLPRCFDADVDGERPYVLLEYLEGPRLSTLIRRQRALAVEQALPLGLQLSSALHYMHAEGMLHLDVKPKNIVMGGPPRLVDLSVAMSLERAVHHADPIGTDAYMAPEQCGVGRHAEIGPTTDLWGLGVTLYEAMTGRLPFPRGDAERTGEDRFTQLVHEPAPLPKAFPPVLSDPMLACLRHDPAERPVAAELYRALEPLVGALPTVPTVTRRRPRI